MSDKNIVSIEKQMAANATSAAANQRSLGRVRARVVGDAAVQKRRFGTGEPGQSQKVPDDPFHSLSHRGLTIEPPFDLLTLAMLPEHNTELQQCLDAMENNIDGFGHRFLCRVKPPDDDVRLPPGLEKAVLKERVYLSNFFNYCTEESFTEFRKKLRRDLETTGNAYYEVVRNVAGKIQAFTHLPSYQMRLGRLDDEPQLVERPILELMLDGSVRVSEIPTWKRFRKYVQAKTVHLRNLSTLSGFKTRWFKEFGDPRTYDNQTGQLAADDLPMERRSNEVVHMRLYSTRTPYGLPRHIGNLLSIFGDRAAEEINYVTFRNNNVPSMAILVSNGQLTEGSLDRIESFVESQIQGSDNYSKFLLIEAESATEDMGEDSNQHIRLDIKPLTREQHKDALFQNYSENNQDKIRRVWRLPPIFVGRSDDYTRATAESSRRLADEQIFAPERDEFDAHINRVLFPSMGIIYHKFKSNSPNTTDNQQLVKILAGAEKTGGMTPRIARDMLEDILSKELPGFEGEFPPDVPFSLTMAEAVKNKAEPTEPGQQVTAIKSLLEDTEDDTEGPDDGHEPIAVECSKCGTLDVVTEADSATGDDVVDALLAVNKRLERQWQSAVESRGDDDPEADEG